MRLVCAGVGLLVSAVASASPFDWPSDRTLPSSTYFHGVGATIPADGPIVNIVTAYGADPTDGTDTAFALSSAESAAASAGNQTVIFFPAGTYRFDQPVGTPGTGGNPNFPGGNFRIRGAVDSNGNSLVTWDYRGNQNVCFSASIGITWDINRPRATITGGLTKGSNQITVSSDPGFTSFGMGRISFGTDPNLEWLSYDTGSTLLLFKSVRVIAKSGTTLTLDHTLIRDYTTAETSTASFQQWEFGYLNNFGIENITIDGANSSGNLKKAIDFQGAISNCWLINIRVRNVGNYGIALNYTNQCTFKDNWIEGGGFGPNHGGFLVDTCTNNLFLNNLVIKNQPDWEINQGSSGNVFAHNVCPNSNAVTAFLVNHGPQNEGNLYEGNVMDSMESDGYFGGTRGNYYYRNWITAWKYEDNAATYCIALKRFDRQSSFAGNVYQLPINHPTGFYNLGFPNIGNGSSNGNANSEIGSWWIDTNNGTPKTWDGVLTTRTSNTAGVVTLGTGQGASLQIHKTNSLSGFAGYAGQQVTLGTITGDVVNISGTQVSLPAQGDPISFQVSVDGFQELDGGVAATLFKKGNFNYNDGAIPADEALDGAVLQNSWWTDTAPEHFVGPCPWPPVNPLAPGSPTIAQVLAKDPAGYRYLNGAWPTGGAPATTATISVKLHPTGTIKLPP